MTTLQKFKDGLAREAFRMTRDEALEKGVCKSCGEEALPRCYSDAGRREYKISGLCEKCFDRIMSSEDGMKIVGVIVTKEDKEEWRGDMYDASADAVKARSKAFEQLKAALLKAKKPLDVGDWYSTARQIASACNELIRVSPGTLFYHPMKNIDPEISGSARTFRDGVNDLEGRVKELDVWITG